MKTVKNFIDLPNSASSHDTIFHVIASLDVAAFSSCFEDFVSKISNQIKGLISIDGKTIKGSHDAKKSIKPSMLFLRGPVSANVFWPKKKFVISRMKLQLFLHLLE